MKNYKNTIDLRSPRENKLRKIWIKKGILPKYNYFVIFYRIVLIVSLSIILFNSFKTNAEYNPYKIDGVHTEIPRFLYDNLKIECKSARNPKHCLKTGLSIAYAESTWGNGKILYNYFGLTSRDKSIKSWVTRYNKYWYKAKNGFFFYGDRGVLGKSHYCTDEISSNSNLGCPNGRKNFNFIYNKLKILD